MYMNEKLMIALHSHTADMFLKNDKHKEYFREQELGSVNLFTGKIVANDPLILCELDPFIKGVSPGTYMVRLYIYHCEDDQRVAFAEICFNENMPVRFEPALKEEQSLDELGDDEFFGYGVDTGTGCFMDEQTCQKLQKLVELTEYNVLPEFDDALEESYVDTYSTANFTLPNTEMNIVAFSTGYGDGAYPSFWGYDASGEVCCLITDFCIIDTD